MTSRPRSIVVTGAGGFIGGRLARAVLAEPMFKDATVTFGDMTLREVPTDRRVRLVEGSIGDERVRRELLAESPDLLFHLAGILGGAAEMDYRAARRINLNATLRLLEAVRSKRAPPRVVFASSIAVFGPPLPPRIDDSTVPFPLMNYGAQKRMIEIAIEQFSARGCIDGVALRLPGVVARPDADARLKSAFLNRLFAAVASGHDIILPVSAGATSWLISVEACVDAFIHAALLSRGKLGRQRAFTLPAQCLSFGELVKALRCRFPHSRSNVSYESDPAIEAQFGSQPPLATPLADSLGFRHDGDPATLVARALA